MLSAVMLSVVMLSVVAPYTYHQGQHKSSGFGVNLIKLFWHKFTFSFCELDVFIAMQQILCMIIKSLAFKKVWVNQCQNIFMRSTPIKQGFCWYWCELRQHKFHWIGPRSLSLWLNLFKLSWTILILFSVLKRSGLIKRVSKGIINNRGLYYKSVYNCNYFLTFIS